jgi:hypothetical protein
MALRYFIPTVPAAIFGLAWCLHGAVARGSVAVAAFFAAMMIASLGLIGSGLQDRSLDQRHAFGVDLASRWLGERPPQRLLFFWADTAADLAPDLDRNFAEVGGFFLRRAGIDLPVDVIRVPQSADAAAAVAEQAARRPGTAILWLANAPSTNPLRQPVSLMRDPRWECRDFGADLAVSVGCRPR